MVKCYSPSKTIQSQSAIPLVRPTLAHQWSQSYYFLGGNKTINYLRIVYVKLEQEKVF